jgi:hypothetical protein
MPSGTSRVHVSAGMLRLWTDRLVTGRADAPVRCSASSRVPSHPHLAPVIARDVHQRVVDSFGRPSASPLVPPRPARPSVGRRESGGKPRPPTGPSPTSRGPTVLSEPGCRGRRPRRDACRQPRHRPSGSPSWACTTRPLIAFEQVIDDRGAVIEHQQPDEIRCPCAATTPGSACSGPAAPDRAVHPREDQQTVCAPTSDNAKEQRPQMPCSQHEFEFRTHTLSQLTHPTRYT